MGKKFSLIVIFFILLLVSNLFLTYKVYLSSNKNSQIKKILNEISYSRYDNQFSSPSGPAVLGDMQAEIKLSDNRVANLKNFFRKYNSPLYDYADNIVAQSDKYHFDYRLLPAIAMQESNLCRHIPENSHNCWGWGIYGNTVTQFDSYEEAITVVSKGLKEQYLDKGLVTASAIMQKYTPSSNGSWQHGVNTFLRMLE